MGPGKRLLVGIGHDNDTAAVPTMATIGYNPVFTSQNVSAQASFASSPTLYDESTSINEFVRGTSTLFALVTLLSLIGFVGNFDRIDQVFKAEAPVLVARKAGRLQKSTR
jgi:hypothetical protein